MRLFRKRIFWIGVVMVIVLFAAGAYLYSSRVSAAQAADSDEAEMQTAVAHSGDITILASGSGQLVADSERSLGFDETGTLTEIMAEVGSQVLEGDLLARLQTENSQASIDLAISEAQLAVIEAQKNLDELYANAEISRTTAMNDISTYSQEVRDAQYQLENYTIPTYLQGMDAIEAVDSTKAQLDAASSAFEPYRLYPAYDETRYALLVELNEAQSQYDAAVKRLNYEYQLQVAEANLAKARLEYEKYEDGPAQDDAELAQAQLDNAQAKLELAQGEQSSLTLLAPMAGTVTEIAAGPGEVIGAESPFITISNLQKAVLTVYLDESDLSLVSVGNEAEVTFDAFEDTIFYGRVTAVNPSLVTVSNVQAVEVEVVLDDGELPAGASFPVGLNATVDIISAQTKNAVLVPIEALRLIDSGEYGVFVVENGEPVFRAVEVGLQDITYAEILSGLNPGEVVSTGITQAQ